MRNSIGAIRTARASAAGYNLEGRDQRLFEIILRDVGALNERVAEKRRRRRAR
jgi:hypothetical protein